MPEISGHHHHATLALANSASFSSSQYLIPAAISAQISGRIWLTPPSSRTRRGARHIPGLIGTHVDVSHDAQRHTEPGAPGTQGRGLVMSFNVTAGSVLCSRSMGGVLAPVASWLDWFRYDAPTNRLAHRSTCKRCVRACLVPATHRCCRFVPCRPPPSLRDHRARALGKLLIARSGAT